MKAQDYEVPVKILVSIEGVADSGSKYNNNLTVILKNDRSQTIVFDTKNQELGNYWLRARSLSGKNFSHSLNLHMTTKKYSAFVQTDKAIYKPGDKVQFRVLVVDSNTRPYKPEKIEIFVTDGAHNRIKQFNKVSFLNGIFQNELQLSDEPVMGSWSIRVKINDDGGIEKSFEVAEYVLPKFEVIITTKRNVKFDEKVLVSFSAKYTYGKQVTSGTAKVTAELADSWWNEDNLVKLSVVQELSEKKNIVEFDLVKDLNLKGMWDERDVKITVNFKDSLTNAEQNASKVITIYRKPYKVKLSGNHDGFKPGLPFLISAVATDLEGFPVMDSTSLVTFMITYTYDVLETDHDVNNTSSSQVGSTSKRPFQFWRPPHYLQTSEIVEKSLENGEAKLTLNVFDNVTSFSVTVS